jgi:hypothetical protein
LNRFVATLVKGSARLAFWRKPAAVSPDEPQPENQPPAPSFLARLKGRLRRTPPPEQPEADVDAATPREEENRNTTASEATPADEADAVPASRMQRVRAVLTNKWVWIPGISSVLLAIMATMMVMLVQSKHEQHILQTKLQSTQKELKKTTIEKQVAVLSDPVKDAVAHPSQAAGEPVTAAAGSAEDSPSGVTDTDCVITDQASVIKNLKHCIDSYNSASAQ